jgi:two-component sensor histidine kinase/CheY-like chemotaxis protein
MTFAHAAGAVDDGDRPGPPGPGAPPRSFGAPAYADGARHDAAALRREISALRAELAAARRRADEYAHRNRNLMTVAGLLIRKALDTAPDLDAARAALADLGRRLGTSHDAEIRVDGGLRVLAAATLAGFDVGPRPAVAIEGPSVDLAPAARRLMALVLFELATNAVKHGALGTAEGKVTLAWMPRPTGGLALRWTETGMSRPGRRAGRGGGGMRLLQAVREELGGKVVRRLRREGLHVEIELPAQHVTVPEPEPEPGGWRTLVVEDNALIAMDLSDMLPELRPGEVVVAATLEEAARALEPGRFDLVLLDADIGGRPSDGLLDRVGEAVVVVVSGAAADELPERLRGLPRLAKPYGPNEFEAAIARALAARER